MIFTEMVSFLAHLFRRIFFIPSIFIDAFFRTHVRFYHVTQRFLIDFFASFLPHADVFIFAHMFLSWHHVFIAVFFKSSFLLKFLSVFLQSRNFYQVVVKLFRYMSFSSGIFIKLFRYGIFQRSRFLKALHRLQKSCSLPYRPRSSSSFHVFLVLTWTIFHGIIFFARRIFKRYCFYSSSFLIVFKLLGF